MVIALAVMTACMFCLVFVQPVVSAADQLPVVGTFLWNRALIPMSFGVAVLAGVGTDLVAQRHSDRKVRQWFGYGFVGLAVVLGALWLFGRGHLAAAEAEIRAHSFLWPAAATGCGLVLATLLWVLHSRPPSRRPSRVSRRTWRRSQPSSRSRRRSSSRPAPRSGRRARSSCRRRPPRPPSSRQSAPRSWASETATASTPLRSG